MDNSGRNELQGGTRVYVIGSLRNPIVSSFSNYLRVNGIPGVFDDWMAGGPQCDDEWKAYHLKRGDTFLQALLGEMAKNIFRFDKEHLDRCSICVIVAPFGVSAPFELGYAKGRGCKTAMLMLPEELDKDRWDVMYQFCDVISADKEDILAFCKSNL